MLSLTRRRELGFTLQSLPREAIWGLLQAVAGLTLTLLTSQLSLSFSWNACSWMGALVTLTSWKPSSPEMRDSMLRITPCAQRTVTFSVSGAE